MKKKIVPGNLELQTTSFKWIFGPSFPTISDVKIWKHPLETTIKTWLFRVPGSIERSISNETCFIYENA